MSNNNMSLLDITVTPWPTPPLPLPRIVARSPVILREDAILDATEGEPRWVDLLEEFYLHELMDLRLNDPEAIRAFASEWGFLEIRAGHPHDEPRAKLSLDSFMYSARTLRDQIRMWLWYKDQLTRAEVIAMHEAPPERDYAFRHLQAGGHKEGVLQQLAVLLNNWLAIFHVRLEVHATNPALPTETRAADLAAPMFSLFDVIALQWWNAIALDADYRRCANETCRRPFHKQRTALAGTGRRREVSPRHRSDAKYCSPSCARAQASRDWRRRQGKGGRRPPHDKEESR